MAARVYWVLNGLVESPKCLNEKCNNRLDNAKFTVTKKKQPCYCSLNCLNTCKTHIKRVNETKYRNCIDDKDYWKKIE